MVLRYTQKLNINYGYLLRRVCRYDLYYDGVIKISNATIAIIRVRLENQTCTVVRHGKYFLTYFPDVTIGC